MKVKDYGDGSYKIGEDFYEAEANFYCREEDVECAVRRIVEDKDLPVEQSVGDSISFGLGIVSINGCETNDRSKIEETLLGLISLQGFFFFYLS